MSDLNLLNFVEKLNTHKLLEEKDSMSISATTEIYDNLIEKNDYQSALPIASKLVTIRGEAQDWLAQGMCQTILGQIEEAMESFARTIDIDPSNYAAWSNFGGLLNSIGKVEDALLCFYKAIELEPNNLEVLTNIGTALNNIGKHEEALKFFDSVVQQEPKIMMAWANRGLTLGNLKRYDEALCSFEQALQIEPNYEIALVNRGSVLLNLYRYDEALTAYDLLGVRVIQVQKISYPEIHTTTFVQGLQLPKLSSRLIIP